MKADINEWMKQNRKGGEYEALPRVICSDGFSMSVQASRFTYCSPRESDADFYSAVEVGFPNRREILLKPYAEDWEKPTQTVYGWVPVGVINQILDKHGGIKLPSVNVA